MKPKIIICAGMLRSGSTWQYNTIRLSLIEAGFKVYGCWIEDFDARKANGVDYVVVKTHDYFHEWAVKSDLVFVTVRTSKGIKKSCDRVGIPCDEVTLRKMYQNHSTWLAIADHITAFNRVNDLTEYVKIWKTLNISDKYNPDLSFKLNHVPMKVANLKQPQNGEFHSGFHPVTLLHPKHISNE